MNFTEGRWAGRGQGSFLSLGREAGRWATSWPMAWRCGKEMGILPYYYFPWMDLWNNGSSWGKEEFWNVVLEKIKWSEKFLNIYVNNIPCGKANWIGHILRKTAAVIWGDILCIPKMLLSYLIHSIVLWVKGTNLFEWVMLFHFTPTLLQEIKSIMYRFQQESNRGWWDCEWIVATKHEILSAPCFFPHYCAHCIWFDMTRRGRIKKNIIIIRVSLLLLEI